MPLTPLILPVHDLSDIWGIAPAERTRLQLAKAELADGAADTVLLLRGDVIYDDAVLRGLSEKPDSILVGENGERLAVHGPLIHREELQSWLTNGGPAPDSFAELTPATAGFSYNRRLRKKAAPQCHIVTKETAYTIEWQLYKASYKGVTDLVTKYIWPVPAFHATRLCAKLGLSPNVVTTIGAVLMFAALLLFWNGQFGWGLLAGWIMTFLDTVDGKLARCTLTSSKWGNIFDHGIDLLHPPFWYIAWGFGLSKVNLDLGPWLAPAIIAMFTTYVLGRLCEGYFIRRFGFHIHVWRRGDSMFREIVARRNPNMIILTLSWMLGRPDIGFVLIVLWTVAAVPIHLFQIYQAETQKKNGSALTSWLSA